MFAAAAKTVWKAPSKDLHSLNFEEWMEFFNPWLVTYVSAQEDIAKANRGLEGIEETLLQFRYRHRTMDGLLLKTHHVGESADRIVGLIGFLETYGDMTSPYNQAALDVLCRWPCTMAQRRQMLKDIRQYLIEDTLDAIEAACRQVLQLVRLYAEAEEMLRLMPYDL